MFVYIQQSATLAQRLPRVQFELLTWVQVGQVRWQEEHENIDRKIGKFLKISSIYRLMIISDRFHI